jgi:hypothetical protein
MRSPYSLAHWERRKMSTYSGIATCLLLTPYATGIMEGRNARAACARPEEQVD